jgi:sialate O-acetylesterase
MLSLDLLFSESAVLQRDKKVCIWGLGDEGTTVSVSIQGRAAKAAVKEGKWEAWLPPLDASSSEELKVGDGSAEIVVKNVAVGEVWIAGGQSNMEFPMRALREFTKLKRTSLPSVRLYGVPRVSYEGQLRDDDFSEYRTWRPCTPEHLWFYSAVPFYFAAKLYEKYGIPVGILNCNFGGSRACAWADRAVLEKTKARVWIDDYEAAVKGLDIGEYTTRFKANPLYKTKEQDHSPFRDRMWRGFNGIEAARMRKRMRKMFRDMPMPVMGPLDPNRPSALYEHMLKPIAPYGARGVIWYQGEGDDAHPDVYDEAMGAVIDSWRGLWKDDLPFLTVQLAPYSGLGAFPANEYPLLRAMQEKLSKTKDKVYITNVMDAGMPEDIHPKAKKPVGERLALLAMGKVYGEDIVCEAPEVSFYERKGNRIVITFINCGEGLKRRKRDIDSLDVTVGGTVLPNYSMRLDGNRMALESDAFLFSRNTVVRYGMRNYCECNIVNGAGIPIKPFEIKVGI